MRKVIKVIAYLILIGLVPACQMHHDDIKPSEVNYEDKQATTYTSILKEKRVSDVVSKIKGINMRTDSDIGSITQLDLDLNNMLKVVQKKLLLYLFHINKE